MQCKRCSRDIDILWNEFSATATRNFLLIFITSSSIRAWSLVLSAYWHWELISLGLNHEVIVTVDAFDELVRIFTGNSTRLRPGYTAGQLSRSPGKTSNISGAHCFSSPKLDNTHQTDRKVNGRKSLFFCSFYAVVYPTEGWIWLLCIGLYYLHLMFEFASYRWSRSVKLVPNSH